MTTLREAAQQALEALDSLWQRGVWGDFHGVADNLRATLAEDAMQKFTDVNQELEAALAEPGQEPVAWMYDFLNPDSREEAIRNWVTQNPVEIEREKGFNVRPLYTTPPQRKPPATIDEIFDRMNKAPKGVFYGHDPMTIWMEAWRAAEQHGIKDD